MKKSCKKILAAAAASMTVTSVAPAALVFAESAVVAAPYAESSLMNVTVLAPNTEKSEDVPADGKIQAGSKVTIEKPISIAQGTLHIEIANDVNTDVKKVDAELTGTNNKYTLDGLKAGEKVVISFSVAGTGVTNTEEVTLTVVAAENYWKKDASTPVVPEKWVYGDTTAKASGCEAAYGEVVYLYAPAGSDVYSKDIPEDAGKYTVIAVVEATKDYTYLESEAVEFEILKAENAWIQEMPAIQTSYVYGEKIELTGAEAKFGEAQYLFAANEDGAAFSNVVPQDAGSWKVMTYVPGTSNYTELKSDKVLVFTITQAANSIVDDLEIVDGVFKFQATYGEPVYLYSDAKDGDFTADVPTEAGTYYVKAVVEETANYTGVESKVISFEVEENGEAPEVPVVTEGWITNEDGTYSYVDAEGNLLVSGEYDIEREDGTVAQYRFDDKGIMITGWYTDDTKQTFYYSKESGARLNSRWGLIEKKWYYFGENGVMYTDGLFDIDEQTYWLGKDGAMLDGWYQNADKTWMYFSKVSGAKLKDRWIEVDETWYKLDANGIMQTGWVKDNNKWYYMRSSGAMGTGWMPVNGFWYYGDLKNGYLLTGLQEIDGDLYYFYPSATKVNPECSMAANVTLTINGIEYTFGADGAAVR